MGKVNVIENVVNVSKILREHGASAYSAAQGFTLGANGLKFAVSLDDDTNPDKAALIGITDSHQYVRTGLVLGHGNDCTYYSGYYYVTVGGDSDAPTTVKRYKLDTLSSEKWVGAGTFTYDPIIASEIKTKALTKVSAIAHIFGENFILSQRDRFSVCRLDETNKKFVEFSRFQMSEDDYDKLSRSGCGDPIPQAMYYARSKVYKAFSYRNTNTEEIKENDIAVLSLKGTTPSFNGISLDTIYSCDRTSKLRFEVEGIGASDGLTNMYMYANVKESESSKQSDSIYSITLQD